MIIKNVIVYTEDKKFTAGGIVVHDDKIDKHLHDRKRTGYDGGRSRLTDRGHTQSRD